MQQIQLKSIYRVVTYGLVGYKLQAHKVVLIEFAPSKLQRQIHIKCQKISHLQMDIFSHLESLIVEEMPSGVSTLTSQLSSLTSLRDWYLG